MSDLDRIAEMVADHQALSGHEPRTTCKCGWTGYRHSEHVADALIAAGCRMPATPRRAENTRSEKPSRRRWIAPRTGGYRPGGDFRADANYPPPTPTTAPKGPGGVIPRGRSETPNCPCASCAASRAAGCCGSGATSE